MEKVADRNLPRACGTQETTNPGQCLIKERLRLAANVRLTFELARVILINLDTPGEPQSKQNKPDCQLELDLGH